MKFDPDILAEVTLLLTEEGGRAGPTLPDMFGCPLGFQDKFFDMRMDLTEIGRLAPGSTAKVPIRFLCPDLVVPRLRVGSEFTLWEGKTLGSGFVIEVKRDSSSKPNGLAS